MRNRERGDGLATIFGDDPEGALTRVIDRIDKSLEGDKSSWIDTQPAPAEVSGPVHAVGE